MDLNGDKSITVTAKTATHKYGDTPKQRHAKLSIHQNDDTMQRQQTKTYCRKARSYSLKISRCVTNVILICRCTYTPHYHARRHTNVHMHTYTTGVPTRQSTKPTQGKMTNITSFILWRCLATISTQGRHSIMIDISQTICHVKCNKTYNATLLILTIYFTGFFVVSTQKPNDEFLYLNI